MKRLLIYFLGFCGGVYLLNLGFGVGELIPDNLPIAGNLDEALASIFVYKAMNQFRKNKNEPNKAVEPTIMAVTPRAPSSTSRASHDRGSL